MEIHRVAKFLRGMRKEEEREGKRRKKELTWSQDHDSNDNEGDDGCDDEKCNANTLPVFILILRHEILYRLTIHKFQDKKEECRKK